MLRVTSSCCLVVATTAFVRCGSEPANALSIDVAMPADAPPPMEVVTPTDVLADDLTSDEASGPYDVALDELSDSEFYDGEPSARSDAPGPEAEQPEDRMGPEDVATGETVLPDSTTSPVCPAGYPCVTTFPFTLSDSTAGAPTNLDGYACAPGTDESGPERVIAVIVPEAGFLSAAVFDDIGVDVDVHILSTLDAADCLSRGDHHASADVGPGLVWVVVDSWVSGAGTALDGDFRVDIGFLAPSVGPCDLEVGEMARVGDGGNALPMPATGPVVGEAHLVTQEELPPYPTTKTEKLAEHYALSQSVTGLVMYRSEAWAPLEGGAFYGAGIGSPTVFPVLDEGWYVNMYWTAASRPAKGTRMITRLPGTDRAVVVSAGYETGPGDLSEIGGTPEETHFYLGTKHEDTLTLGIATDQTLPLGPRLCTP